MLSTPLPKSLSLEGPSCKLVGAYTSYMGGMHFYENQLVWSLTLAKHTYTTWEAAKTPNLDFTADGDNQW